MAVVVVKVFGVDLCICDCSRAMGGGVLVMRTMRGGRRGASAERDETLPRSSTTGRWTVVAD